LVKKEEKMSKWFWRRSFAIAIGNALVIGILLTGCSGSEETVEPVSTPTPEEKMKKKEPQQYSGPPPMTIDEAKSYTAIIRTNLGDMTAELYPQDAPITVNNFVFLAREGFYDESPFHRVMKDFMIQAGTPAGLDATGPGYDFDNEPVIKEYAVGTLAMANRGPNTNGSQFFICDADLSARLSKDYTIFGQVTQGIDVVHEIASVPVAARPGGEKSKPTTEVYIKTVTIEEE